MPWWSWVIIWVALVIVSLGYLVLLGLKLWRHLVALGREAAQASQSASERFASGTSPGRTGTGAAAESHPVSLTDPFISPAQARTQFRQAKIERKNARRHRRVQRRRQLHQAQSLTDLRAERSGPGH